MNATKKFGTNPSRFTFTLTVDYNSLDKKLGCHPASKTFHFKPPPNTTNIEDIFGNGNKISTTTYNFLDSNKKQKRWILTMKDSLRDEFLPDEFSTPYRCWWCHDSFTQNPLGCPIKFIEGGEDEGYYLTKGYFCCWQCLLAYGESIKLSTEYRECIQFIYQMYEKAGNTQKINPAPHYSLKQEYGGPLTQSEYKSQHDTFQKTGNNYIRMVPVGELFEMTSKF